ncbi:DUF6301 family protein [Nocardia sp. NPDC058058]|uniref:DUF6301 family protein n=1 Tax=Nocardia sp. NPDC058058 TaxID=3346317 RepID=UPI0036DD9D83
MRADIGGAFEVARVGVGFGWTWVDADLGPLTEALGWQITESRPLSATLATTLQIDNQAALVTGGGDEIKWITVCVTDAGEEDDPETVEFVADAFTELSNRLIDQFGAPTTSRRGSEPEMCWERPGVSLELSNATDILFLRFVNPQYQARMNAIPAMRDEYLCGVCRLSW